MPNHTSQLLTMTGPEDKIEDIVAFVRGTDEEGQPIDFDGRKIIETPEELKGTRSPALVVADELITEEKIQEGAIPQSKSDALIRKYGHNNWYDWNLANMGTKWGIYDSHINSDDKSYFFQSAWSPANAFIVRLSRMFPDVHFNLKAADEGGGFLVEYNIQNGEEIATEYEWDSEVGIQVRMDIGVYYDEDEENNEV